MSMIAPPVQAAPGWVPKPFLRGHEDRIFLLDFFGAPTPTKNGIKVRGEGPCVIPPRHLAPKSITSHSA